MINIQADTIDELVIIQEAIGTGIANFRDKVYAYDKINCNYELSESNNVESYLCKIMDITSDM